MQGRATTRKFRLCMTVFPPARRAAARQRRRTGRRARWRGVQRAAASSPRLDGISITIQALDHLNRQTKKKRPRFNMKTSRTRGFWANPRPNCRTPFFRAISPVFQHGSEPVPSCSAHRHRPRRNRGTRSSAVGSFDISVQSSDIVAYAPAPAPSPSPRPRPPAPPPSSGRRARQPCFPAAPGPSSLPPSSTSAAAAHVTSHPERMPGPSTALTDERRQRL